MLDWVGHGAGASLYAKPPHAEGHPQPMQPSWLPDFECPERPSVLEPWCCRSPSSGQRFYGDLEDQYNLGVHSWCTWPSILEQEEGDEGLLLNAGDRGIRAEFCMRMTFCTSESSQQELCMNVHSWLTSNGLLTLYGRDLDIILLTWSIIQACCICPITTFTSNSDQTFKLFNN